MITKLNEYLGHSLNIIYKVSKDLGYTIVEKISGGAYGYAFLTSDNEVLKVSYDRGDAVAADILIGKKCEYLADCYHVHKTNEFDIIVMEKLDTENLNEKKLKKAMTDHYKYFNSKMPSIGDVYRLCFNSYFRDFIKIYKESRKYNVRIDTQNSGNFGLKNGHLAAFDLGGRADHWSYKFQNLEKIKELEKFYDEITKSKEFSGFGSR